MRNKIKIQHYVPRFYLRNFSIKQGRDYTVNCFDKIREKIFSVNIKRVGAEKYFYDTSKDTNQIIEKSLGRFESKFDVAYNKIIKKGDLSALSKKERRSFAYFIATQEIRTREFREILKDAIRQLTRRLSKEKLSEELERQLKKAKTNDSIKSMQIGMLIKDIPTFANIMLSNMKWTLLVNKTNLPYWTSDHPVNRYNPIDLGPYGNLGLLSLGIQIYFPLSTKVSLCLSDPIMYHSIPEKYEVTNEQNVIFQNHLQVKSSTRHIFSIDQNFSLAEKMINDIPELKDINRKRVTVS